MIKFTILNSILNGDLIPWLNANEQVVGKIDPCYLKATASVPVNDIELHEQVATLVQSFPALSDYLKTQTPAYPSKLIPSFYSIRLPQHTDTFTAYYYLTFRQETLRLFNLIINKYSEMDDEMKSFLVNENLKELKYLALSLTEKMNERGFTQTPNPHSEPVLYALYVARYFVIHLFFELQELFADVVKSPVIPKAFFQTFLKELYNEDYLNPAWAFYEFRLMFYIDNNLFSYESVRKIFDQLKAEKSLEQKEQVVAKYENAIYLHLLGHNPAEIQNLLNNTLVSELFNHQKTAIQNRLNSFSLGLDRLDLVNDELNKLYYTDTTTKNHHSVPSLLYHWLTTQATVYTNAASNVFTAVAAKESGTEPKVIIQKVNVEEQKATAYRHLAFFQGVNAQNEKIMTADQFQKLITAVNSLIEFDLVPAIEKPLPQINLPTNYIRYTFYLLHKSLYTSKAIRDTWINFLHDMFAQFGNAERKTTKTKFSEKPPLYDTDLQQFKK